MHALSAIDMATRVIPHLRHQFREARPVLFTGAGFSLGAKAISGRSIPGSEELSKALWGIAYPDIDYDPGSQLQDIFEAAVQAKKSAVSKLLNESFTVDKKSLTEFHRKLLSLPWSTVYTLNIDNLIENGLNEAGQPNESISALRGASRVLAPSSKVKVVHLNGVLEDAPDAITFSREQYASRSDDAFFASLVRDLKFNPVIFFGTSLEENLLWKYLRLRGLQSGYGERELRPRSYLVTPDLDLPKGSLLSKFNISWFQGTAEDFCNQIFSEILEDAEIGRTTLNQRLRATNRDLIQPVGSSVKPPEGSSEYLFGAEPTWDDAQSNRIAQRPSYYGLTEAIDSALRSQSPPNLVIVSGTAGSGKSSAMRLEALHRNANGFECGWVDRNSLYDAVKLDTEIERHRTIRIIFIEDADLLQGRLVSIAQYLQSKAPQMTLVAECRSAKVDNILAGKNPSEQGAIEFTIPHLADEDIDSLLDILSSENRLGRLKGKSREEQFDLLKNECGRQLLVAMFKATQGQEFQDKATGEFLELPVEQQVIYAIASVSHAHRLYIERDEIAIAFGDDHDKWPQALEKLCKRKLLLVRGRQIRTRHREIAQFIYDKVSEDGRILDALRGLIKISGSKSYPGMRRNERPARMLARFISNNLLRRHLAYMGARTLYQEFENLLAENHHYWLHRGALELKEGHYAEAKIFLNQAKGIEPNDIFVDVELIYLALKEAVQREERGTPSEEAVDEALYELERIAETREDQRAHVTHIGATQTLAWLEHADLLKEDKQRRINHWLKAVNRVNDWQSNELLEDIERQLRRAMLSLATSHEDDS